MKGLRNLITDSRTCRVYRGDRFARLTFAEFDILKTLLAAKGRPIMSLALFKTTYSLKPDCDWPTTNVPVVMLSRMRRKLEPLGYTISNAKDGYIILTYPQIEHAIPEIASGLIERVRRVA